jgi:hypothetical protein
MQNTYRIGFFWDDEANVWIATSDDIKGLVLEDESFDTLVSEVHLAVPSLLGFGNIQNNDITLNFIAHRQERLAYVG